MSDSIALGTTKRVWHVVAPNKGNHKGMWYCFDTKEEAEMTAKYTRGAQVSEGTATYSSLGEGLSNFWAVSRPEYDLDTVRHG